MMWSFIRRTLVNSFLCLLYFNVVALGADEINEADSSHIVRPPLLLQETTRERLEELGIQQFTFPFTITEALRPSYSIAWSSSHPAKDQGPLGTCTSFATGACLEHFYGYARVSEAYLTVKAEQTSDDCLQGISIDKMMAFARDHGAVEEKYWGYDGYVDSVARLN